MEKINNNEEKELNDAIIKRKYEYYKENRKNFSEKSEEILERIKEGYDPNEADVFELLTTDPDKIDEYRTYYDIKNSISKDGKISENDLNFLIQKLNVDDQTAELLTQLFIAKNKIK